MDGMKVNGQSFLTKFSRNIIYRTAQWVKNQTAEVYRDALIQVFHVYNTGGFKITTIHCDNNVRPLMEQIINEFQVTRSLLFLPIQGNRHHSNQECTLLLKSSTNGSTK
jgi:hypothetical protein